MYRAYGAQQPAVRFLEGLQRCPSDLPSIRPPTEEAGLQALEAFSSAWDSRYPQISCSWQANWANLATLFEYPTDIRKMSYTTNAIESMNSVIRHAIVPNGWLSEKGGVACDPDCSAKMDHAAGMAMSRFIIGFGDRLDGRF